MVSAVILPQGYQHSAFIWLCAALASITLETVIFKNLIILIPAAAAEAGAMVQFSTGDAHTTMIASSLTAFGMTVLLFKKLSRDQKAEEKARLANLKKGVRRVLGLVFSSRLQLQSASVFDEPSGIYHHIQQARQVGHVEVVLTSHQRIQSEAPAGNHISQ